MVHLNYPFFKQRFSKKLVNGSVCEIMRCCLKEHTFCLYYCSVSLITKLCFSNIEFKVRRFCS